MHSSLPSLGHTVCHIPAGEYRRQRQEPGTARLPSSTRLPGHYCLVHARAACRAPRSSVPPSPYPPNTLAAQEHVACAWQASPQQGSQRCSHNMAVQPQLAQRGASSCSRQLAAQTEPWPHPFALGWAGQAAAGAQAANNSCLAGGTRPSQQAKKLQKLPARVCLTPPPPQPCAHTASSAQGGRHKSR
jgi:hypothetical protein